MKRNLLLILSLFMYICGYCENYPYRSDVLWVTVPDHADWIYKTGENPKIQVQLYKYGIPVDDVTLKYEIGGDMMPADATGTTTLKKMCIRDSCNRAWRHNERSRCVGVHYGRSHCGGDWHRQLHRSLYNDKSHRLYR